MGLDSAFVIDLTTGWDVNRLQDRLQVESLIKSQRPALLVGSPKCTAFSQLMSLNRNNMDPVKLKALEAECVLHLTWVCKLYRMQYDSGRFFLHEHPWGAHSWQLDCVDRISKLSGVYTVLGDMCRFELMSGFDLVRKRSGFMTNSSCIAENLSLRCFNDDKSCPEKHHVHQHLVDGRAKSAEDYTPQFVKAVLKGLLAEMKAVNLISAMEVGLHLDSDDIAFSSEDNAEFYDNISGALLDPVMVKSARKEEISYMRELNVYRKIKLSEALKMGLKPIKTKWLDQNKGDLLNPLYRSRLVGQELKVFDPAMEGIHASTPPLESLKLLFSIALLRNKHGVRDDKKIQFLDVSRAHLHAPATKMMCIILPPEETELIDGEQTVGLMQMSLYGTRSAAHNWEAKWYSDYKELGFTAGASSPCIQYHAERCIWSYIYGDDFVNVGSASDLLWLEKELSKRMIIKNRGVLGSSKSDCKQMTILNRLCSWVILDDGCSSIELEGDPRHVEIMLYQTNLDKRSKGVSTPGIPVRELVESTALDKHHSRLYRGLVMRGNYLAMDRPDIQFACKELARSMQSPCADDWLRLKRLCRYLQQYPRLVQVFLEQDCNVEIIARTDSDFAGCKKTRKSTSSVHLLHGCNLLRAVSATQNIVTLSSGEAEFLACVRGGSLLFGLKNMLVDYGYETSAVLEIDSSAGKGICNRRGVGRIRHLHTSLLWIQQAIYDHWFRVRKINGTDNSSDIGTKHVPVASILSVLKRLNFETRSDSHSMSLKAAIHSLELGSLSRAVLSKLWY